MNANQVSSAATAELVAFFNKHAAKSVARFADRKTAERRVLVLVAELAAKAPAKKVAAKRATYAEQHTCPSCGATADQTPAGLEGTAAESRNFCHHCGTEYFPESGKVYNAPVASASRSAAIAKSWTDAAVASARSERTAVVVKCPDGKKQAFGSVAKAFKHLGLPLAKHIPFRMALKAEGKKEFNGYKFAAQ